METVQELVEAFREDEKDSIAPYFWSDAQLLRWTRQAVDRFCEVTRSVFDRTSSFTTIEVSEGDESIARHSCIIDIVSAKLEGPSARNLDIVSTAKGLPNCGMTRALVVDNQRIGFFPAPNQDATIKLEVTRRPVKPLELSSKLTDVPASWRENLLLFLKHRAYRVHDAEVYDPAEAADYLAEFERACQQFYEVSQQARRPGNIKFRW